ncbi:MAG: malonyl-CoA decarboxylase domain-containing protein, partial [Beijerinckiaceae bacterium]
ATTAVFYSISNCQKGLARISFGNFLIKQVAEELKREIPSLSTFVTLSPVPGFRRWLSEAKQEAGFLDDKVEADAFAALDTSDPPTKQSLDTAAPVLRRLLARYLLQAKNKTGQPLDPVARFHLGNGARLERLNLSADLSAKGMAYSYGAMVNYLYDLALVEENHERYAAGSEVVASAGVHRSL